MIAKLVCGWQAMFTEKNNDALHTSLAVLITESRNPLVKKIFEGDVSIQQIGKLTFISIGSKFRSQLGILMEKLGKTVCTTLSIGEYLQLVGLTA